VHDLDVAGLGVRVFVVALVDQVVIVMSKICRKCVSASSRFDDDCDVIELGNGHVLPRSSDA
jgi:hypothetical protein